MRAASALTHGHAFKHARSFTQLVRSVGGLERVSARPTHRQRGGSNGACDGRRPMSSLSCINMPDATSRFQPERRGPVPLAESLNNSMSSARGPLPSSALTQVSSLVPIIHAAVSPAAASPAAALLGRPHHRSRASTTLSSLAFGMARLGAT